MRDKLDRLLEAHFVRAVQDHDAGKVRGEHDSPAMALVRRAVQRAREGHEEELQTVVEQALIRTVERLKHAKTVVENDVSPEEAKATLAALEEVGLLVPRGKVVERAEQIAQERLQALKAEHGLPVEAGPASDGSAPSCRSAPR